MSKPVTKAQYEAAKEYWETTTGKEHEKRNYGAFLMETLLPGEEDPEITGPFEEGQELMSREVNQLFMFKYVDMGQMVILDEERSQETLEEWRVRAANTKTPEDLAEFVRHLCEDYVHDYGTIVHACVAAAVAACWTVDAGPQGGITGFQASAIMWQFMRDWNGLSGPARLLRFKDLLYPQNEDDFAKTISQGSWDWLVAEAQKNLEECHPGGVHPTVQAHWESIVAGEVPFGYTVESEDD